MSPSKFVGRFALLTVINTRSPPSEGGLTETDAMMNTHHRIYRRVLLLLASALLLTCTGYAGVNSAYAGSWMEVGCENPDLSAAPSEDWTSFTTGNPGYGSNNSTSCTPGNPMIAILSSDAPDPVGSGEDLQYIPPGGSTLIGGQLDVGMYADGYGNGAAGTAVAYSPGFGYNSSDVIFQCAWGQTPCSNGTSDFSGVLALPENRGGNFYIGAGCGSGYNTGTCNEGGSNGAWSLVQVWWADFLLSNSATPSASGIGGTLLSPGARGTQELTFTANDHEGPGVYIVTAQVDGTVLYSGTPDSNGGKCVPVGSSGEALMFDFGQPCRESESVDLPINTASLADGQHTLKVTVQDAAQNSSVVYDGIITTNNAPMNASAPTILTPSQVFVGTTLSTDPGSWAAPTAAGNITYGYQWEDCDTEGNNCQAISGAQNATYTPTPTDVGHTLRLLVNASDNDGLTSTTSAATSTVVSSQGTLGAPNGPGTSSSPNTSAGTNPILGQGTVNGRGASEGAVIGLGLSHTISRSFADRAFKLDGRLIDNQQHPIGEATLDVFQETAGSGSLHLIGKAKTEPNGTFTIRVPAGPSRLIEVSYRAFSNDTGYAALAKVEESVRAGVQLHIAPRETKNSEGTIVLTGEVLGPIPPQGTIVDLQVHYRGRWVPFRTPQTGAHGHFEVEYQFEGAAGVFPFRALVPAGQADFPFSSGYSKVVDVTSG